MKKLSNTTSPFIMMLVPVFLLIAVLIASTGVDIPAEKYKASSTFRMPTLSGSPLKVLVQSIF